MSQLRLRDIGDVGLVSPPHAIGFFERAGFGDDREGSVPMKLSLESFQQRCSSSSCLASRLDARLQPTAHDWNLSLATDLHALQP